MGPKNYNGMVVLIIYWLSDTVFNDATSFKHLYIQSSYKWLNWRLNGTWRNFGGWWHCIFIRRSADFPYYWEAVCWHLETMPEKWVPNSVVSAQNVFLILYHGVFHHQSLRCSSNTLNCWCVVFPLEQVRIQLPAKVLVKKYDFVCIPEDMVRIFTDHSPR